MTFLLQFLAVLGIVFLCSFHVFRRKETRRKNHLRLVAMSRSLRRRSVTRSEWKKGLY